LPLIFSQLDLTGNSNSNSFRAVCNLDKNIDDFDENTGDSWIFPVNYEKRDYQLNISKTALFQNTLVILPTGLGKTFIASVVIYNFYRWFPKSKIIFMAPTKPLVNQQLSACYDIVGISKEETAELTGCAVKKEKRKELWNSKRVFFCTPQCIVSDIESNNLPTNSIKLVVIDEAHKSKGDYAYCKVIKAISSTNHNFRVLALTATAGRTNDVIQIIQNLLISKIEHRDQSSIDVRPYTHKKVFETIKVQLGSELKEIQEKFIELIDPYIREIKNAGYARINNLCKGFLIIEQNRVRMNNFIPETEKSKLLSNFTIAVSLYHSLELLERHGLYMFLKSFRDENNTYKYYVNKDFKLKKFVTNLDKQYGSDKSPLSINSNPMPNGGN
jgi:fanconi anemia group M protein